MGERDGGCGLPPDDSLIRRAEDAAKVLRREGEAAAAEGRKATAERRKSLDAIMERFGDELTGLRETVAVV